jgi:hypothetical protein
MEMALNKVRSDQDQVQKYVEKMAGGTPVVHLPLKKGSS